MDCIFILKTEYGTLESEVFEVTDENFPKMCNEALKFHMGSWSMTTSEGLTIVPPEVLKKSILIIKKIKQNEFQEQIQAV